MKTPELQKQVIVITGANSGIGFGLTKSLLQKGYHEAALDVKEDQLLLLQA